MPREFRIPVEGGQSMILQSPRDIDAETAMRVYASGQTPEGFTIAAEGQQVPPSAAPQGYREKSAAFQQRVTAPLRSFVSSGVEQFMQGPASRGATSALQATGNVGDEASQRLRQQVGQFAGTLAGEVALPSTPEGQAMQALLMLPVIGGGAAAVSRALNMPRAVGNALQAASRVAGAPTATLPRQLVTLPLVGGGVADLTGADLPTSLAGSAMGLVPPVLSAGLRGGKAVGRVIGDWSTRGRNIALSGEESSRALAGTLTDLPSLAPTIQNLSRQYNPTGVLEALADEKIGKSALKGAFQATDQSIVTGLEQNGVQTLNLPQLAGAVRQAEVPPIGRTGQGSTRIPPDVIAPWEQGQFMRTQGIQPQPAPNPAFTSEEALNALKEVAWRRRELYRQNASPADRHAASVLDNAVDLEFRNALIAANRPDLARQFLDMSNQFRKGVQYFNFWDEALSASRIGATAPGETTTPLFNWDNIRELMRSTDKGLSRVEFPSLYAALWSRAPIGASGQLKTLSGIRLFANTNNVAPGASIPTGPFQLYHPMGEQVGISAPNAERVISGLTLGPLDQQRLQQMNQRNLNYVPIPR